MRLKLFLKGLAAYLTGIIVIGLLVFVPAGTLQFFGGWLFIGLLFVPMLIMGAVMLIKSPSLLEKRLRSKEKEAEQKGVIAASGIMFLSGFVVAGLNYRFGWPSLPEWASIAASVLFLLSYLAYAEVLRENEYLSRTVEVQKGQKVIDTGLYGIVRHPMYSATVVMFLCIPLILGSFFAFLIFLIYPVLIVRRIMNEEKILAEGLEGYEEYRKKVRYRLIPFLW